MIINFVNKSKNSKEVTITPIIVSEMILENDLQYNYKVGDYIKIPKNKFKRLITSSDSSIKSIESSGFYKIIGIVYDTKLSNEGNLSIYKTPTIYVEDSTPPWC